MLQCVTQRVQHYALTLAHRHFLAASVPIAGSRSAYSHALSATLNRRGLSPESDPAISISSTLDDVYEWARQDVKTGGAGLEDADARILWREKIKGTSLFSVTESGLTMRGMPYGACIDLLAAVARLRELPARLQPPLPFLRTSGAAWPYQGSDTLTGGLRSAIQLRYAAWTAQSTDKRTCPVFTVTGGPGCGKSRLLSELPRLCVEAAAGNGGLESALSEAFVFHVGFENGTLYQLSELDGASAVGNRMMWQLVRPADGHGFHDFAVSHSYSIDSALSKLSDLTGVPRAAQHILLLVDGLDKLIPSSGGSQVVFDQAARAVSAAVCSTQLVFGAISTLVHGPIDAVFGRSQQARVFLQPPLLSNPELVVPDMLWPSNDARDLTLLRNGMGGYGRALETLFDVLSVPGRATLARQALSERVMHRLLDTFDAWLRNPDVAAVREQLLEAIVSRRPFSATTDVVAGTWTVDTVCSLGLVRWQGSVGAPQPLVAPFVLLLMLRSKLRAEGPLYQLALGYDKLETGSRIGNRWQDFEGVVAAFRAVKASAFRGHGWVRMADLHFGARLSATAKALHVRTPLQAGAVVVTVAAHRYHSKSSDHVEAVVTHIRHSRVDLTSGDVVVINGVGTEAADVFLNCDTSSNPGAAGETHVLRESYACRHRTTTTVDSVAFHKEWRKAAVAADLFIFFTPQSVDVDLDATGATLVEGSPNFQTALVGYVDSACFKDYFGFSCPGRTFPGDGAIANDGALSATAS